MITFIVERHLPDVSGADLRAAAIRARDAADQLTREGRPIRYLRTTYRPDDGSCHCLFEADSDLSNALAQPFGSAEAARCIAGAMRS